jgi:hypothetical protein
MFSSSSSSRSRSSSSSSSSSSIRSSSSNHRETEHIQGLVHIPDDYLQNQKTASEL